MFLSTAGRHRPEHDGKLAERFLAHGQRDGLVRGEARRGGKRRRAGIDGIAAGVRDLQIQRCRWRSLSWGGCVDKLVAAVGPGCMRCRRCSGRCWSSRRSTRCTLEPARRWSCNPTVDAPARRGDRRNLRCHTLPQHGHARDRRLRRMYGCLCRGGLGRTRSRLPRDCRRDAGHLRQPRLVGLRERLQAAGAGAVSLQHCGRGRIQRIGRGRGRRGLSRRRSWGWRGTLLCFSLRGSLPIRE